MTRLRAIHFPETTLATQEIMGQALLFDTISYIIPTALATDDNPLCPTYDPAPLGDDAKRFGQLLDELKGNETAFYQGQMSTLALEYLETRPDDTVRDIINAVHGHQATTKTPEQTKAFEKLWQARLLLKLAEIMRKEQQEVHASLQRIKDAQEDMLGDLKGEEEFQDLFHALKKNLPNQMPVRVEKLIKAWGRLFTSGSETFDALHCLSPEAGEPFMEISESITGLRPQRLLRLPLPDCSSTPDKFQEKRERWHEDNATWLGELKDALHKVTTKGSEAVSLADFSQLAATWTSKMEQTDLWPQATGSLKQGPPALEFYLLGADMRTLVAKLCGLTGISHTQDFTLLAFISRRPTTCS